MKKVRDIEFERLVAENASLHSRVDFLENRLENSVSRELYDAKVAECESWKAEATAREALHKEELTALKDAHRRESAEKDKEMESLNQRLNESLEVQKALVAGNMDLKGQMQFWQSSHFAASSERMVDEMNKLVGNLPETKKEFMIDTFEMINRINSSHGSFRSKKDMEAEDASRPGSPDQKNDTAGKSSARKKTRRPKARGSMCNVIREVFGLDFSNLGPGSKVIMRNVEGKKREEVSEIEILFCQPARFFSDVYKVANCNVPGVDGSRQTRKPRLLFLSVPVDPSFARFYLEMKFGQNRSEGQIVEYLHKMGCRVPQSTLNRWMHAVMDGLMKLLLPAMKEEIRQSRFTHNDETRILVRSFSDKTQKDKYQTEYIHGIYSPSANLFLMMYKEGSRSHDVQMEIFDGSAIEAFLADRYPGYKALISEFETPPIRGACWIHFRRYLLIAFKQDDRLEPAVQLLARIFAAEKIISRRTNLTETERVRERQVMCKPLVEALFKYMQGVLDAGSEYGSLARNAANYLLDDKEGFGAFLTCGLMEISNNAIEKCFRHLALGRRNWLQCGSHEAAEHTAFMYSLVESCRMNKIDFGDYIEYVLREIMNENKDYRSLLPNHVKLPEKVISSKVA